MFLRACVIAIAISMISACSSVDSTLVAPPSKDIRSLYIVETLAYFRPDQTEAMNSAITQGLLKCGVSVSFNPLKSANSDVTLFLSVLDYEVDRRIGSMVSAHLSGSIMENPTRRKIWEAKLFFQNGEGFHIKDSDPGSYGIFGNVIVSKLIDDRIVKNCAK